MSDEGHPILGDRKYGLKNDDHKRLALHAKSISFKHPATGRQMDFTTKTPAYFNELMKLKTAN
jgi:23S rRNA-/tRNA-specific pseudouridylate synthase